ncbi:MAG: twin-arginine translocase TatA/TatE family subunit [Myxococcota bacterium]
MFGLGTTELLIVLAVVLIVFGAGKLPEVGRMLGSGIRNFQRSVRGEDDDNDTPRLPDGNKKELPE